MRLAPLVFAVTLLASGCAAPQPSAAGNERHLRSPEDNPLLVMAQRPDDLSELIVVLNRGDRVRLGQLFDAGRLVDWQIEGGKRVLVLDHDYRAKASDVRLLEGPEVGQTGWVFDTELAP